MSTPKGEGGSAKSRQLRTRGEGVSQIWMFELKKKCILIFFTIIWKYFPSNIIVIFKYSVLNKIRLDGKVYPSLLHKQLTSIRKEMTLPQFSDFSKIA